MFSPAERSSSTRKSLTPPSRSLRSLRKRRRAHSEGRASAGPPLRREVRTEWDARKHVPPSNDSIRGHTSMKKTSRWFSWKFSLAAALAPILCTAALAQNTNAVAEREAARRQAALPRGEE